MDRKPGSLMNRLDHADCNKDLVTVAIIALLGSDFYAVGHVSSVPFPTSFPGSLFFQSSPSERGSAAHFESMGEVKELTLPLKKVGEVHYGHLETDFSGVVWGRDC